MARSPRSTPSKARSGGKARGGSSKSTGSSKVGAARTTAKRAAARSAAPSRSTSKASAGRKSGPSKAASKRGAGRAQSRAGQGPMESWAASIGSLLTSQPGRETLAEVLDAAAAVLRRDQTGETAAADMARTVADALARVTTDATLAGLSAGESETGETKRRSRGGGRKRKAGDNEGPSS